MVMWQLMSSDQVVDIMLYRVCVFRRWLQPQRELASVPQPRWLWVSWEVLPPPPSESPPGCPPQLLASGGSLLPLVLHLTRQTFEWVIKYHREVPPSHFSFDRTKNQLMQDEVARWTVRKEKMNHGHTCMNVLVFIKWHRNVQLLTFSIRCSDIFNI